MNTRERIERKVEQDHRRVETSEAVPRVAPGMSKIWIDDGVPKLIVGNKDGSVWGIELTQLRSPKGT